MIIPLPRAIRRILLVLSATLLCSTASAQVDARYEQELSSLVPVPFETINQNNTKLVRSSEVVVRDFKSFAALWAQHYPNANRPDVDFGRSMVAAMFLGQAANGCYTASVSSVLQGRGVTRIEYQMEPPDKMSVCLAMLVYPSVWITLPKMKGKVRFVRVDRP